jgi:pimeloyl-ACP methyl ester carboxylesterase
MKSTLMLCCALLVCVGACATQLHPPQTAPAPPSPQSASAHGLYITCAGEGAPVVVLEAGAGNTSSDWARVMKGTAPLTRVCAYDRAGLGKSPPGPPSMSALDHARALAALLEEHGERGPYVLVGHSYGGIVVRVFAGAFPDRVAGLVLVDSSVEDFAERRAKLLGEKPTNFFTRPIDWPASFEQARRVTTLGDRPLVVLTANRSPWPDNEPESAVRLWIDMQQALAKLSTRGTQRMVDHTGHMIPIDAPDAVVTAISEVVRAVRGR